MNIQRCICKKVISAFLQDVQNALVFLHMLEAGLICEAIRHIPDVFSAVLYDSLVLKVLFTLFKNVNYFSNENRIC